MMNPKVRVLRRSARLYDEVARSEPGSAYYIAMLHASVDLLAGPMRRMGIVRFAGQFPNTWIEIDGRQLRRADSIIEATRVHEVDGGPL